MLAGRDLANLKAALDQAAIVAITDSRGVITYANQKFVDISQYASAELIGKTHKVVNSGYHPPEFFAEMWKTIKSGKVWEGEIRNRAKDGSYYWVHTTIVPFLGPDGTPESYVSVRYDVTERVLAQEMLKLSNRELEEFASVAAHDLQEPLRKIRSFSDRLQNTAAKTLAAEHADYLTRMANAAERMQNLINDLLSYARITTRGQPFANVDLGQIACEVTSDLETLLQKTNGRVEAKDLPTVRADATQMRQLLQNLIANGLKFHKPDCPPLVSVRAFENRENGSVTIEVRDNGIGFDEKYLDRIFTIFQRLHGRFEYEGTGIGLAICRKIVDRHGGEITAQSKPGEGAAFLVTLPQPLSTETL